MRKMIGIVTGYSLFSFIVCIVYSFVRKQVPELLPGETNAYLFRQSVLLFFNFLPSLLCSGFLVGCSISFSKKSEKVRIRFSAVMMESLKSVILTSIFFVLILAFVVEVLTPFVVAKQKHSESAPSLYREFLELGKKCYESGRMTLAAEYANNAKILYPKSEEATILLDLADANAKSQIQIGLAQSLPVEDGIESAALIAEDAENDTEGKESSGQEVLTKESVTSFIKQSEEAAQAGDWFKAHYYAMKAVEYGNDKDINLDSARILAAEAWNKLLEPVAANVDSKIFDAKREAYFNFVRGDYLKAYYQFAAIANMLERVSEDQDVEQFLKISKNAIQKQCFFLDEIENLRWVDLMRNIYFTILHDDGSRDVVFIRGIAPIKDSGKMVQYLRGLTIYTYAADGKFIKSVFTSYAKMLAEPVDMFDPLAQTKYGIKTEYKSVPYILLKGIDRLDNNKVISPSYIFDDSVPQTLRDEGNFIILTMPVDHFSMVCEASLGANYMNLFTLFKLYPLAKSFGYSSEIFGSAFLFRVTYPLLMLIVFIFLATVAWNYRLNSSQLFKFKWVVVLPFLTAVFYFLFECIAFLYKILNYVFVASAGFSAIVLTIFVDVVLLAIVSFMFLSRRSK